MTQPLVGKGMPIFLLGLLVVLLMTITYAEDTVPLVEEEEFTMETVSTMMEEDYVKVIDTTEQVDTIEKVAITAELDEMTEDYPVRYIVRPGDTLYRISRKYGITVADIVKANNINNPDLIHVGQELWIKGKPREKVTSVASRSNMIKIGNSYYVKEELIGEITAYCACEKCCGKTPDHPAYGVTASGAYVKPFHTVAAGSQYPFGTLVQIGDYAPFEDVIFRVEDRFGRAPRPDGRIDVYFECHQEALRFGRRNLPVTIYTKVGE